MISLQVEKKKKHAPASCCPIFGLALGFALGPCCRQVGPVTQNVNILLKALRAFTSVIQSLKYLCRDDWGELLTPAVMIICRIWSCQAAELWVCVPVCLQACFITTLSSLQPLRTQACQLLSMMFLCISSPNSVITRGIISLLTLCTCTAY